ncbi:hypothetical protein DSL40_13565 [Mycobacterium tuberculosis]|nr:hypothetical protein DSL40_13565 [Mycobacterium tuberculosis]
MVQAGLNHTLGRIEFEDLIGKAAAAPQPLLGEDDGREAGDQRAVQVEKRTDLRAGRTGQNLGYRTG